MFIFYDNFCNSDLDTFAKVRFKWFGLMLQNLGGFPCERLSIRVFCFTKISVPRALHEGNENLEPYDPCFLEWSWHIAERQVPLQLWDLIVLNKIGIYFRILQKYMVFFPGTWRALSLLSLRCCSWRVLTTIRVCRVKREELSVTGAILPFWDFCFCIWSDQVLFVQFDAKLRKTLQKPWAVWKLQEKVTVVPLHVFEGVKNTSRVTNGAIYIYINMAIASQTHKVVVSW